MKPIPHKKRQLVTRALTLIARRRAKFLASQRGEPVSKADIAAGRQFARSLFDSIIANPFWLKTIDDIATAMKKFVFDAERQGAPAQAPSHAKKVKTQASSDKIAAVEKGLRTLAKIHGKTKARQIFFDNGIPIRAPGSGEFIHGYFSGPIPDRTTQFWALPLPEIEKQIAAILLANGAPPAGSIIVEEQQIVSTTPKPQGKETPVSGIEAPKPKKIYSPSDFMPTSDDMIGLASAGNRRRNRAAPRRRRQISKQRYEAFVAHSAKRIARKQNRGKPSPADFALAKKLLDKRLQSMHVTIAGGYKMGLSDIMGAAYVLGQAAQGSPAAQHAIMKSVEAAKEGNPRARKNVAALAIAKKKMGASKLKAKGAPRKPKGDKAIRNRRLLRSFYGAPYPRHPAFKINR